jgi:hypothetical protein
MNYRNYMHCLVMDSNLVTVDGKVYKNRWGHEEFTADETMKLAQELDQYVIQFFDRREGILELTSKLNSNESSD